MKSHNCFSSTSCCATIVHLLAFCPIRFQENCEGSCDRAPQPAQRFGRGRSLFGGRHLRVLKKRADSTRPRSGNDFRFEPPEAALHDLGPNSRMQPFARPHKGRDRAGSGRSLVRRQMPGRGPFAAWLVSECQSAKRTSNQSSLNVAFGPEPTFAAGSTNVCEAQGADVVKSKSRSMAGMC